MIFSPFIHRYDLRWFILFCVMGLLMAEPSVGLADFGPGPDKTQIEAERERLQKVRKDAGDHAFATYAIARLKLLARALPVWHPDHNERALQIDTGEHLRVTRPYFSQVALEMLGEIGDERALPVLESFMAMEQIAHRTSPNASRWMTLSWHEYYLATEAWLWIKLRDGPYEATILDSLEHGGLSTHVLERIAMKLLERDQAFPSSALFGIRESSEINLIEKLATTRSVDQRIAWNMLETLAELRAFYVSDQVMQEMLVNDNPAIRLAAAMVLYRQAAAPLPRPERDPERAKAEEIYCKEAREKNDESKAAREAVAKVWRDLIKARQQLDDNVGQAAWHHKAKQIDPLLGRLFMMTAFTSTDPYFIDELVDSLGWRGAVPWLWRAFDREGIPLTPERQKRLVQWLDSRAADEATLRGIAWMLIDLDQRSAADDIVRFFNRSQVLDGLALHPRYVIAKHRSNPQPAELSPDWLVWLKKHSTIEP